MGNDYIDCCQCQGCGALSACLLAGGTGTNACAVQECRRMSKDRTPVVIPVAYKAGTCM